MASAQGKITFHKIIDGRTLTFAIVPNFGSQVASKDPVSFSPNFTTTPLKIVPYLTVSGNGGANEVKAPCVWYYMLPNSTSWIKITSGQAGFTIGNNGDFALSLSQNLTGASLNIKCEYDYVDTATGLHQMCVTTTSITRAENPGTAIFAQLEQKLGIFVTREGRVQNISFVGHMLRGGQEDTTDVQYSWEITGTNGNFYKITAATAPAGSGLPAGNLFSGFNTATLTISSDAVANIARLKFNCKDTDSKSSTYNVVVSDIATILDQTDPCELVFDAIQGTALSKSDTSGVPVVIKIRQGSDYWQDAAFTDRTLSWWRVTATGVKDTSFNPPAADFAGWSVSEGTVSRTFNSTGGLGTEPNRTIRIRYSHLLDSVSTTFEGSITF